MDEPQSPGLPPRLSFKSLPPLNALKGFEAAARLGSFRRAADELNVTHVAISHQIKQLEADLTCPLFLREGRSVTLTPAGRIFYEYVREALERLVVGAGMLRRTGSDSELRIETYITVAVRWLSPMLSRFRRKHPDIAFSVNTRRTEWWFDEANTDIAIMYVEKELPSAFRARRLIDGTLFPVCSPRLMERLSPTATPEALAEHTLIAVSSAPNDWQAWFQGQGVEPPVVPKFQMVDTYILAMELAQNGDGVAMLNGPFANEALKNRTLVVPFPRPVPSPGYWAVIYRADRAGDHRIRAFLDWLSEEVRRQG